MRQLSLLLHYAIAVARQYAQNLCVQMVGRVPGQGLVEYGLILVLIMVVCVAVLTITGETISEVWYDKLINRIP